MAEGWAKSLAPKGVKIYSAGIMAAGVNKRAIAAMKEVGIDISDQTSNTVDQIPLHEVDLLVTVCNYAKETCPTIPIKVERIHWDIEDPVRFGGTEEQVMEKFRKTRDELKERIQRLFSS